MSEQRVPYGRVLAYGPGASLVEVADADAASRLAGWLRGRVAARDVVPAARTVLVDGLAPAELVDALPDRLPDPADAAGALVEVPVVYDGPDLADVAQRWGCTVDEVVARHTALEFTALFTGFAPGFAYLGGLPADLAVPRLDTPRAAVPAGAVGLADRWCGVYPRPSPGGWRLLGHTRLTLFDADRDPPALLAPGTRVRFVEAR